MAAHRTDEATLVAGRYTRGERLGHGGFGVVWRAHDGLLQRDVAVKEIHFPTTLDDDEHAALRDRVLREARAAARVSHPGLVTVFDVVEEDGPPLIVMELVDAPTLSELVVRNGPLPDAEAADIGCQVLDALSAAHAHGIVHRDVKPSNVMVHDSGRVQLADFGVASMLDDPKVTSSGQLAGSPSYMAPEQAESRTAGAATDLWGLGATLYYAVEGLPPFDKGNALATLTSVVTDAHRPMQRARALRPLLEDLMHKDPLARPRAAEVRRRLSDVAEVGDPTENFELTIPVATANEPARAPVAEPITPTPPPPPPTPPAAAAPPPKPAPTPAEARAPHERPSHRARRRRSPVPLVAAVLVLALLGGLVGVLAARDDDSGDGNGSEVRSTPSTTAATGAAVPSGWIKYRDPTIGYTLAHPPNWTVNRNGTLTEFRDPATRAYLRIDHQQPPGPSPEGAWYSLESAFAADHANYKRIQITPTTYKSYRAALWEFTYTDGGADLHAYDLGFIAGNYGFALNFQTKAADWDRLKPMFEQFKSSFQAPS